MDAESIETLNGLVMRWRQRADRWHDMLAKAEKGQSPGGVTSMSQPEMGVEKLDGDIEMLVRHLEGLGSIQNTLQELDAIRNSLLTLRRMQTAKQHAEEALAGDLELQAIDNELRELRCNSEDFLVRYMMIKDDYRSPPESLPLPYGFKCHKQYKTDLELLKSRLQNAEREAAVHRERLRRVMEEKEDHESSSIVFLANADINAALNAQNQARSALYHLLMHVEPIDLTAFHARCGALVERRMQCLERKRREQIQQLTGKNGAAADKPE